MKLKIKKIDCLLWMIIILLVTFPSGLRLYVSNNFYSFIASYGSVIAFLLSFTFFLHMEKIKLKEFKMTFTIIAFRLLLIILAIFVSGEIVDINESIKRFLAIVSLCFVCEYFIKKNRLLEFINCILFLYGIYLCINLFLTIKYPTGLFVNRIYTINNEAFRDISYQFLGFRNYFGFYLIPVLGLLLLKLNILSTTISKKDKFLSLMLQFLIIVNVFLSKSSTSILALLVFYLIRIIIFIFTKKSKIFKLNVRHIIIAYLICFVLIVLLNRGEMLREIIASWFNKSVTLTGRTKIWNSAINLIKVHPFLGYGKDNVILMNGNYWYAHNGILDLLIQGGILALFSFIKMCSVALKSLKECDNSINLSLLPTIAAFAILMFAESCVNYSIFLYVFLVFIFHCKDNKLKNLEYVL